MNKEFNEVKKVQLAFGHPTSDVPKIMEEERGKKGIYGFWRS